MNKEQFIEQFSRLSNEWPRSYGESKRQLFAKEFGGHEYLFFKDVVDTLLRKFRYAPQVTDVWSAITDVNGKKFRDDKERFKPSFKYNQYMSDLPRQENMRRWGLLATFIGDKQLQKKDPDWLRKKIWPNETKEESARKYSSIMLEDAVKRKSKGY